MRRRKKITRMSCLLLGLLWLCSCGSPSSDSWLVKDVESEQKRTSSTSEEMNETLDTKLVYESSMKLSYAEEFSIDYYQGGYMLLTIKGEDRFFLVPEGKSAPKDMSVLEGNDEDIVVLQRPIENIYLVASSAMDMVCSLDAIDHVTLSGQKKDGWYIKEAREAMENGKLMYAGKYNKPDYELIVSKNCSLAIENTMISHSPEVVEKLEEFGIPVFIDCASYESHPFGRVEWIKVYGALLGREAEAEELYEEQIATLERISADKKTGKTVAFFFITSNGLVQVRQSSDYIPKMIELAGGNYIFSDLGTPDSKKSTINLQIEAFYEGAKDADYLIYNSSIDGGITSLDELFGKCELLEDFKAVREGNVWCTTNDVYQQSMSIGSLMEDIHIMLQQGEEENMRYLFHLE